MTAARLIKLLGLKPHPEWGYFRETYRSAGRVPPESSSRRFPDGRNFSTAIFYLLPSGSVSTLHRLHSDEVFHFYSGGPMTLVRLAHGGRARQIVLGPDPGAGHSFQHVVPAGEWFGAYPSPGTAYSLLGCTVAPGFDFGDFEIAGRAKLTRAFPSDARLIARLTR